MDNTIHYDIPIIARAFSEHIHTDSFGFKNSNAGSVLEFLYIAYTDVQDQDPEEISHGFMDLDKHLSKFSLEENNEAFGIVCKLCNAYEKRAFMDAIQIGAYLMMELQGK